MMEPQKQPQGKEVELRSAEVQEVMDRIPSAIVRWGMTVMAVIVTGLLAAAAFIPWPETVESPFEMDWDGDRPVVTATLSPQAVKYLSTNDSCRVTLFSPMFDGEDAERGVRCVITALNVETCKENEYDVHINMALDDTSEFSNFDLPIAGDLLLIISEKTVLRHVFESKRLF